MVTDAQVAQFYNSRGWKMVRQARLNENPLCQACQMSGIITPAIEIHHMLPIRTYWEKRFDAKYLLSLCTSCHSKIEMDIREQEKTGGEGKSLKPLNYNIRTVIRNFFFKYGFFKTVISSFKHGGFVRF